MIARPLALILLVALAACNESGERAEAASGTGAKLAAKAPPPPPQHPPALPGDRPMDDELVCLARAVYFEARGQGAKELSAIAHVAINRRDDPQFPDTICGVVKEGSESPPCQFTWWCDGRSDVARHEGEYAAATKAAWEALEGRSSDPTGGANMFYASRLKRPAWTKSAEDRGRIGAHRFWYLAQR